MCPSRARQSSPQTILSPLDSRIIEISSEPGIRQDWRKLFDDKGPLDVDVGCGKGRFLLARAALYPERSIIGIERQLIRLRKIDRKLHLTNRHNARLIHSEAAEILGHCAEGCIDNLFVFFPDPWPKRRHHKRRIMGEDFSITAKRVLAACGKLHFATDHKDYFDAVLPVFDNDRLFKRIEPFYPTEAEKTDFELIFTGKGCVVNRASWQIDGDAEHHQPERASRTPEQRRYC